MKRRCSTLGFTLIELLVVTVLMAVFTSVAVISYQGAARYTRDARRKKDLSQIQAALEIYKQNNGYYPDHSTCNSSATWPGCLDPWIPGMTSDYMSTIPEDPKQNTTGFIGNLGTPTYTYNYVRITPTTYRILARLENTADSAINGSGYGYSGTGIYVVAEPR